MLVDYKDGRFFISPIIGCYGMCAYCYLSTRSVDTKPRKNNYPIDDLINSILSSKDFVKGETGSIISVGAWGDIFSTITEIDFSVYWITRLLEIGNPVQIMSKFSLNEKYIKKICSSINYNNQLLYSTTITTFRNWNLFEKRTQNPIKRLETIDSFKKFGAVTNVMIKPFIAGYTDDDKDLFLENLKKINVDFCVVGVMYWNCEIMKQMQSVLPENSSFYKTIDNSNEQVIDCSSNLNLNSFSSRETEGFFNYLKKYGINAFKKSSCVNSNILKVPNVSRYYENDPDYYCINCGNCKGSNTTENEFLT